MVTLRKSFGRGYAHHGWLESWHSFSFADYHNSDNIRFGPLRVINEDFVQPGTGFDTHGHRDNMGNGGDISHGEIQLMRAGSGVMHSEFNPSPDEVVHLLQIWIMPDVQGLTPGYWQKTIPVAAESGRWCLLVSPDAAAHDASDDALHIHQDARISAAMLSGGETLGYPLIPGHRGYLQVARGKLVTNGIELGAGDALAFEDESSIELSGEIFSMPCIWANHEFLEAP